eukprot:15432405-Alexandrium_andersonii.AAC.2
MRQLARDAWDCSVEGGTVEARRGQPARTQHNTATAIHMSANPCTVHPHAAKQARCFSLCPGNRASATNRGTPHVRESWIRASASRETTHPGPIWAHQVRCQ